MKKIAILLLISFAAFTQTAFAYSFAKDLWFGSVGSDVTELQKALNSDDSTAVAKTGAGSPGFESKYFGRLTQAAVIRFQKKFGIYPPAGYVGPKTRAKLNSMKAAEGNMSSDNSVSFHDGEICNTSLFDSSGFTARRMLTKSACEKLNQLWKEGKASGNAGDIYANRDNLHVNFCDGWTPDPDCPRDHKLFYQLEWKISGGGAATSPLSGVVIGQASYSGSVENGTKHSIVYDKYKNQTGASELYREYTNNNLFIYPALNEDFSTGAANIANTPYVIASSQICKCGTEFIQVHDASGSELPFLELGFAGLAAFKPEVKKKLIEDGSLMPTLQALIRYSHISVGSDEDYFQSPAHDSSSLAHYLKDGKAFPEYDTDKLVAMANAMTLIEIPPVVSIKVASEDFKEDEKLFTTPGAIGRIASADSLPKKITVSAQGGSDLEYRAVVLKGSQSKVFISVDGNGAFSLEFSKGLPAERLDVGIFVRKKGGKYWSVPGIVSLYIR